MAEKSEGEWRGGVDCRQLHDFYEVRAAVRPPGENLFRIRQNSKACSDLPFPTVTSIIKSVVRG
jgi:hypothetical protein